MHIYAIGLGSNRRHGRHGAPERVLAAARRALEAEGFGIVATSAVLATAPIGLTGRRFANQAAILRTTLAPLALLARLQRIEREFGRRPGRRWATRVLDLDILLWLNGEYRDRALAIPHRSLAERRFVLDPLVAIAPRWRVRGGSTIRQARARLTKASPVHRSGIRSGP